MLSVDVCKLNQYQLDTIKRVSSRHCIAIGPPTFGFRKAKQSVLVIHHSLAKFKTPNGDAERARLNCSLKAFQENADEKAEHELDFRFFFCFLLILADRRVLIHYSSC